jgi:hypothetical protein
MRFISEVPIMYGYNWYAYYSNSPLTHTYPAELLPVDDVVEKSLATASGPPVDLPDGEVAAVGLVETYMSRWNASYQYMGVLIFFTGTG